MATKTSGINGEITNTYIFANKKMTFVSAFGVTIGIAIFIFMNSMVLGFDRASARSTFRTMPHIRIYKDDEISQPLSENFNQTTAVIINPKIVPVSKTILNPQKIMDLLKTQENVVAVAPEVNVNSFVNMGKSQMAILATGIIPKEEEKLYHLSDLLVSGSLDDLKNTPNGIILGAGIAQKINSKIGDNISITSSKAVSKMMKLVGIFKTSNSKIDLSKSYINIQMAQQLVKEGTNFVSDINVNITNNDDAPIYAKKFCTLTSYKAEDWQSANETLVAGSKMRKIIIRTISFSILLVAGFGIYNILNMTITSKINDIAILKAMGFKGKDIVQIFVRQALTIGTIGVAMGLVLGTILVNILQHVYVGGDIGFFPIQMEPLVFAQSIAFGYIVTFLAGFIPARKAGDIDPVAILRK